MQRLQDNLKNVSDEKFWFEIVTLLAHIVG